MTRWKGFGRKRRGAIDVLLHKSGKP